MTRPYFKKPGVVQGSDRMRKDELGNVYGHLTVVGYKKSNKGAMWLCNCECGSQKHVYGVYLRNGSTISCGCRSSRNKKSVLEAKRDVRRALGMQE